MLVVLSILILAYMIMGRDVNSLVEKLKDIDWHGKINSLIDKLRPWALKAGRVAAKPLLSSITLWPTRRPRRSTRR